MDEIISKVLQTVDKYNGDIKLFKDAVLNNKYAESKCNIFTRTLVWKTSLITRTLKIYDWKKQLFSNRLIYNKLLFQDDLMIPWWKLEKSSFFFLEEEKASILTNKLKEKNNFQTNFKQKDSNLKKQELSKKDMEKNVALLQTIVNDVERLFPNVDIFNSNYQFSYQAKKQIIEILYINAKCISKVGYIQGLHEIVGLIYLYIYKESLEIRKDKKFSTNDLEILNLYDIDFLPHDVFTMFNTFMSKSGIMLNFYENEKNLHDSIENFNINLLKIDPLIHHILIERLNIESQLWIIKYFRLLLLRELGTNTEIVIFLWDKLVSLDINDVCNNSFNEIPFLIAFIIIQLLILLKSELINSDFNHALYTLLHFSLYFKNHNTNENFDIIFELFKNARFLYKIKDNDSHLLEHGLRLNKKLNFTFEKKKH